MDLISAANLELDMEDISSSNGESPLAAAGGSSGSASHLALHVPPGPNLAEGNQSLADRLAMHGLQVLPQMAEIYPLGGMSGNLH